MNAVANEFPTGFVHGFSCARVSLNHARIETGGSRQTPVTDGVNDAGQASAHAVICPAEVRNIGHGLFAMGGRDDGARHAGFKLPVLNIDHQMNQDGAFFGCDQLRAFIREAIGNSRVSHGCF